MITQIEAMNGTADPVDLAYLALTSPFHWLGTGRCHDTGAPSKRRVYEPFDPHPKDDDTDKHNEHPSTKFPLSLTPCLTSTYGSPIEIFQDFSGISPPL